MRPFRLRFATAIVVAILMLGALGGAAKADDIPTNGFTPDPLGGDAVPTTSFPEDPWPGLSLVPTSSFPEDPWPGVSLPTSFPEDPWPGLSD